MPERPKANLFIRNEDSKHGSQRMKLSDEQIAKLIDESAKQVCPEHQCCVQLVAIADLPSRFGDFQICGFVSPCDGKEHTAIIKGDVVDKRGVVTRVHSECLTGDVMGSKRCDCRDQLLESLRTIEKEGTGVVLYLRQEGRNIGLTEKIRAYALQDHGLDTIDANLHLGYQPDERDYGIAASILKNLQIHSIKLLTNNPDKIRQLASAGIQIDERLPLIIPPSEYNRAYLEAKEKKSGHLMGKFAMTRDITKIESVTKGARD
jgi:GTP cyclohydrolase II